ncbi:hypothetical protein [Streptomyces sp. PsTaAH-124]|uniref:hypothetical protein n=1 Tax=Streptomyces sp. PsTaAH-124 TaxID=1157638 RepID=UPI00037072E4|nr:hypothetical protein [Streptomyces sp. PsTaAH-124]
MGSEEVKNLQAQAAEDYARHNSPEQQAEARIQSGLARIHAHEAASTPRGKKQ